MGFMDMFRPVQSITAGETVKYLDKSGQLDACLLDVRQPGEFAQGHLPGAKLVPLSTLSTKAKDFSRCRKIIVYCQTGNRSRVAVGMLNSMVLRMSLILTAVSRPLAIKIT